MADRKIYTKMPKNYYNFFDICKWEGIPTGTAKSAIGEKGLEGIATIEKLKPIAHQFKEFPKYENGMLRSQYGILKSNYDFWKKNGRPRGQSTGRPPRWKNAYICLDCGEQFEHDTKKEGSKIICKHCKSENCERFYENINIPVPKKLYDEFKSVVDRANEMSIVKVSYRDMIYVALQEFIERRPQFLSYDKKTHNK